MFETIDWYLREGKKTRLECICTSPDKNYYSKTGVVNYIWICRKCGMAGIDDPIGEKLADEFLDTQSPLALAK